MDISSTTAPKSDQQNYDDYIGGPKTVTISEVRAGTPEQPVEIHLVEFPGRPFKPSKSMRRVLFACWGADSSVYVGRSMGLYGDPEVRFGGEKVGGIRIGALSHLTESVTVALTVTRGKRAPFTVRPILAKDVSGRDWTAELAETNEDLDAIGALGAAAASANAHPKVLKLIRAEFTRVQGLGA